jgi:hypothetical protein
MIIALYGLGIVILIELWVMNDTLKHIRDILKKEKK